MLVYGAVSAGPAMAGPPDPVLSWPCPMRSAVSLGLRVFRRRHRGLADVRRRAELLRFDHSAPQPFSSVHGIRLNEQSPYRGEASRDRGIERFCRAKHRNPSSQTVPSLGHHSSAHGVACDHQAFTFPKQVLRQRFRTRFPIKSADLEDDLGLDPTFRQEVVVNRAPTIPVNDSESVIRSTRVGPNHLRGEDPVHAARLDSGAQHSEALGGSLVLYDHHSAGSQVHGAPLHRLG